MGGGPFLSAVREGVLRKGALRSEALRAAVPSTQRRAAALFMMMSMAFVAPLMCDFPVSTSVNDS